MNDIQTKWDATVDKRKGTQESDYAKKREQLFPRGSIVCDLAGGLGADSLYFIKKGHQVILIDISQVALDEAVHQATIKNVAHKLTVHRVTLGEENIPLDNETVDIIYSRLGLHYFNQATTTNVLKEVYRILKQGGKAFFTVKSPDDKDEMDFFNKEAIEIEPGFYKDRGKMRSKYTKQQWQTMLHQAGIVDFSIETYQEPVLLRDKMTSGNKKLILNEIQFTKK